MNTEFNQSHKPNFFILGGPKCGTTSLYYWLKQHSQIYFPEIKETHYFSTDLHDHKRAIRKDCAYRSLYEKASAQHKILGDASVFHLFSKDAVKNILKFNPDAKFLVMLRNPVEMVQSLHAQYLHSGNEIYEDFEKAWRLKNERIQGVGVTRITEDPQLLNYGEVCKLGEQIERLLRTVTRDRVFFVFLEDLKQNPDVILRDLFIFLDIQEENIETKVYNKATKRKYPKLQRLIKYLNRIKKDLKIKNLNTGFGRYHRKFNSIEFEKSLLPHAIKQELSTFFESDIKKIEKVLDKNLKHWYE